MKATGRDRQLETAGFLGGWVGGFIVGGYLGYWRPSWLVWGFLIGVAVFVLWRSR